MLFLDDIRNITKECDLYKHIKKTGLNLEKLIEVQYAKKKSLTQILDEIANINVDEMNLNNTKNLLDMIEEIKSVLDRINDNIDGARNLLDEINNIIARIDNMISDKTSDELLSKDINYIYMLYIEKANVIEDTNLVYESIVIKTCEYIFSAISNSNVKENTIKEKTKYISKEDDNEKNQSQECNDKVKEIVEEAKEEIRSEKINNDIKKSNKDKKIKKLRDNNTLKISEKQNKVFLPYKIFELEAILKANPDEYSSMEDVIKEEYIVPLDKYKNVAFSRFKEAYNLMRVKEKSSFSEALNLAMEVTLKSDLNPAVITACRDLHELDTYLDCLEKNDLDKFNYFNIEYEISPSIKK